LKNLLSFRTFKIKDVNQVLQIYNFHILNGFQNFHEKPFIYENFLNLCKNILKSKLPFIVCKIEKKIIGFAYLSKFRNKSGYKHTFENSIYS